MNEKSQWFLGISTLSAKLTINGGGGGGGGIGVVAGGGGGGGGVLLHTTAPLCGGVRCPHYNRQLAPVSLPVSVVMWERSVTGNWAEQHGRNNN